MKILLIDDEEINDLIFSSFLEDAKDILYTYQSDGWSALQYLIKCKELNEFPEIIFVDLNMPEMDGFTFIEFYEKLYFELFPHTRLFILTSSILNRDKEKSLKYKSVRNFINKPVQEAFLLQLGKKSEQTL